MSESPKEMRRLLFNRLRKICLEDFSTGSVEQMYHLAGAINKSIELQCRAEELKLARKNPPPLPQNGGES